LIAWNDYPGSGAPVAINHEDWIEIGPAFS
jgi:hypothetical protein